MRSCSVEMDFDQRIQSFSSREFSMTKRNRHPNDDDGWFCGVWMATFFLYIPFFSLSFFNVKILLWLDFHLYLDTDAIIHSFRRMSQNEPRFHIFFFFLLSRQQTISPFSIRCSPSSSYAVDFCWSLSVTHTTNALLISVQNEPFFDQKSRPFQTKLRK